MYSSLKDYANISMVCKTIDKNVIYKFKEIREQGYSWELIVESCLTSIQLGLIYKLLKVSRFQDNDRSKFSINCWSIGFLNEIIFPYVKTVLVEDLNSIMEGKWRFLNEIDDSDPIDFRTCLTSIQKLKILDDDAFTESGLEFQDHINMLVINSWSFIFCIVFFIKFII